MRGVPVDMCDATGSRGHVLGGMFFGTCSWGQRVRWARVRLVGALGLMVGGCGPEPEVDGPAVRAAAAEMWQTRCGNCHGLDGRGDGPSGRALEPRPRDFHDAGWQARVEDAHLRRVIIEGGAAHGLSADMAANPDLEDRPAIVEALVRTVRGFGGDAAARTPAR